MSSLPMEDLKTFFAVLLEQRVEHLEPTKAWGLYRDELIRRGEVIAAWEPPEASDSALAEPLGEHRDWARALRGMLKGLVAAPETEAEARAAAKGLLEVVTSVRGAISAVARYRAVERDFDEVGTWLDALPAPFSQWALGWLESGEALQLALAERFEAEPSTGRLPAGFAARTAGLLGNLRLALRHEAQFDGGVSEHLEATVFGLWDHMRARARRASAAEDEPSENNNIETEAPDAPEPVSAEEVMS